jgi:HK97 family phage major capsid protein
MDIKEEFHTTQASALALIGKAKAEARALSAEEKAEVQNKFSRLKEIAELLGEESKLASIALAADEGVKAVATQSFNQNKNNKESNKMEINKVLEGLKAFGRGQSYEQFALTSSGNSGVLMPKSVPGLVTIRQTSNAFRRGFVALGQPFFQSSVTDNVTLPVLDDTSNVANNNQEGATSGVNLDPTYSASLSLNLVEYHSKAQWVSKKVVNAEDFDITQYLIPLALNRIERQEEADWTAAVIAIGSGVVGKTAAGTTAVTLSELIDWDESFSAAYDDTSKFIMLSKGALAAIRKLADTTNKPFFGYENGSLKTLFGKPVIVNPALGAMTTGQTIAMQVSVDGAIIRDSAANEIVRYENNPAYPGQVGFEAIGYSAFANTNSSIRTLKLA